MDNPLKINLTGAESTTETAIINVLNEITKQMYEGKVKQAETDITANKVTTDRRETEIEDVLIATITAQAEKELLGGTK